MSDTHNDLFGSNEHDLPDMILGLTDIDADTLSASSDQQKEATKRLPRQEVMSAPISRIAIWTNIALDVAAIDGVTLEQEIVICAIEREGREREHDAKAVGRALRKGAREAGRGRFPIHCTPARVAGRRKGSLRSRRFETLVGLRVPRPSKVGGDGAVVFPLQVHQSWPR